MIAELTVGALAATAVTEVVKTLGKEGATASLNLLSWLRAKLTGRGKEALDDLEKHPSSEDNQADLRKQIIKLLEVKPDLQTELQALVPSAPLLTDVMKQEVTGDGSKVVQTRGDGNKITIS